ncbi:MAG: ABC transporter ATP-binding protein [Clostridiales bacterium]|nr:ABC transporter ATP-binding protein [Clostridiales bacterium]
MLLEIRGLAKNFGGVAAVKDVSLHVDKDQIFSIIGPNGAGKTTLFNLVSGVYRVDAGEILFEGKNLVGRPQHEIARLGIARTFQNIRLFRGLTVLENVMTALDSISRYNILSAMMTLPNKRKIDRENREKALEALKLVNLLEYGDEQPSNLPYGLQRRVELARAIVTAPKLLMLDEPAAGLNPSEVKDFIDRVVMLKEKFHFGILIIEHRMQVVNELSERIYVVNFGSLLASGTPAEIQKNPEVILAYIGEEEAEC